MVSVSVNTKDAQAREVTDMPTEFFTIEWNKDFTGPQKVGKVGVWTHSQSARFFYMDVKTLCSL